MMASLTTPVPQPTSSQRASRRTPNQGTSSRASCSLQRAVELS